MDEQQVQPTDALRLDVTRKINRKYTSKFVPSKYLNEKCQNKWLSHSGPEKSIGKYLSFGYAHRCSFFIISGPSSMALPNGIRKIERSDET